MYKHVVSSPQTKTIPTFFSKCLNAFGADGTDGTDGVDVYSAFHRLHRIKRQIVFEAENKARQKQFQSCFCSTLLQFTVELYFKLFPRFKSDLDNTGFDTNTLHESLQHRQFSKLRLLVGGLTQRERGHYQKPLLKRPGCTRLTLNWLQKPLFPRFLKRSNLPWLPCFATK